MIRTLHAATFVFVIAFIAAATVDIGGIHKPVCGSLLFANNNISTAVIATSNVIAPHFYPILGSSFFEVNRPISIPVTKFYTTIYKVKTFTRNSSLISTFTSWDHKLLTRFPLNDYPLGARVCLDECVGARFDDF